MAGEALARLRGLTPFTTSGYHVSLAKTTWALISALHDPDNPASDTMAINLIELACDSAAESERISLGQRPKGAQ